MRKVFFSLIFMSLAMLFAGPMSAFAEAINSTNAEVYSFAALGAAIAIGLGAFGGALGQGNAMKAALEGIGRNPGSADKMFTPMILGLALIESLVIYALLIAFMLVNLIG